MRRLTLIRHGHAEARAAATPSDLDRQLDARGRAEAMDVGLQLAGRGETVGAILSSAAPRARETADLLARTLGVAAEHVVLRDELYLATPGQLERVIARFAPEVDHLVVVAHNPGISDLAERLEGRGGASLVTAGLVVLDVDIEAWCEIEGAVATRIAVLEPDPATTRV